MSKHLKTSNEIDSLIASYLKRRDEETLRAEIERLCLAANNQNNPNRAQDQESAELRIEALNNRPATIDYNNIDQQKDFIAEELREVYKLPPTTISSPNPRAQYLIEKYKRLSSIRVSINETKKIAMESETTAEKAGEKRMPWRKIFDVLKKAIDIVDDIWYLLWTEMKTLISEEKSIAISNLMTSVIGGIILAAEASQGLKEAFFAYRTSAAKLGQRKTRIVAGSMIFIIGLTGAAIASTLFISSFMTVVGITLLPSLIAVMLLSIYCIELAKFSYVLNRSKDVENKMETYLKESKDLLSDLNHRPAVENHDVVFYNAMEAAEHRKQQYEFARNERLNAERNVAFKTLEIIAYTLVSLGTVLSVPFMIGTTAAAILLGVGMVLGIGFKLAEQRDEKKNHKYTENIRNRFINTYHHIQNKLKSTPQYQKNLNKTPVTAATASEKISAPEIKLAPPVAQPSSTTTQMRPT